MENIILTVDYAIPLEQMVATGNYDGKNGDINRKSFPLSSTGRVFFEPQLFHFDRDISSENAIQEMENDGFRPAKIEELLAYGALLPEEQRKYPIIALGSVAKIDGLHNVACLRGNRWNRRLGLDWSWKSWDGGCRFLGVREVQPKS